MVSRVSCRAAAAVVRHAQSLPKAMNMPEIVRFVDVI